jgi:hypothetical protein
VPSPLQNRKRIEALNTLAEDVEASSDCCEKADELSISVNDGQFSDISSVAGDDIDIISRKVEEYTVSTESRQVIEEREVAVGSTSLNYHTVTSAKEKSSTCYEASSIRTEKLNAIKKVKIVGSSWGITFETFADTMVSDPNSHLDLMQNESPVKPYKVEGRSSYFINTDPNTSI